MRMVHLAVIFFFSSRRRHTRFDCDWSSDVCSSDLTLAQKQGADQANSLASAAPRTAAELPGEGDLAIARAAVSEVLSKGGSSVPWETPKSGARGTVTPLAAVYNQDGIPCRDFLASFVKNGSESWLQGAACRAKH